MRFEQHRPEGRKLAAGSAVSGPNVKRLEWMIEHIVIKTLTKLQKNLPVVVKISLIKPVRPENLTFEHRAGPGDSSSVLPISLHLIV
jgi:hypothetical protein